MKREIQLLIVDDNAATRYALLLSPTIIDPVKEQFAPALAITALDLAFKVGNNAWRGPCLRPCL